MNVFDLAARITLDKSEYESGLNDAKKSTNSFASVAKGAGVAVSAAFAAAAAAVGAISAALIGGTQETAKYGDNIDKMSQKLGISAQAYQEWDFIMQHAGLTIDSLQASMKTMASAAQTDAKSFTALGISTKELAELSQEDLFNRVIAGLQDMEAGTQRTYLAGKLLGRGATELGALLNMTAEETDELRQAVHDLGGVMTDDAVKQAAKYQDTLTDLGTAFSGLKRSILSGFVQPVMTAMQGLTSIFTGDSSGVEAVSTAISGIIKKISESAPEMIDRISDIAITVFDTIVDSIPTNGIGDLISRIVSKFSDNSERVIRSLLTLINESVRGVARTLPTIIPQIVSAVLDVIELLTDPEIVSEINDSIIILINAVVDTVFKALPNVLKSLRRIFDNILETIDSEVIDKLSHAVTDIVMLVLDKLTEPDMIESFLETVMLIVGHFAMAMIKSIPTLIATAYKVSKKVADGLADGILNKTDDIIGAIGDAFAAVVEDAKEWGTNVADNFVDWLTGGIKDGWNAFVDFFRDPFGDNDKDTFGSVRGGGGGRIDDFGETNKKNAEEQTTVILELDGKKLAQATYRYNKDESRRRGTVIADD